MTVQAVIFDIGNVLIEWQPERHYDAKFGATRRMALFQTLDLHGMNDKIDRGADFRQTVYDMSAAHPEWSAEIRDWHDAWTSLAGPEIPWSVKLLRSLRKRGVPVFALSNFGIGSFEVAERVWPFLAEFDRRYISGHMGVIKPEPAIYEKVEQDCGFAPDTLLFSDDRADNIQAAAARGWQTHVFDGPEGWAARLVSEGLLTEADASA